MFTHLLKFSFITLLLTWGCLFESKADHLSGGEISYKCATIDGIYEVTLIVYRGCDETTALCANFDCKALINIRGIDPSCKNSVTNSMDKKLDLFSIRDVDDNISLCPDSKNTCTDLNTIAPGTYASGFERYEFKGLVDLRATSGFLASCCNVLISYKNCCRSYDVYKEDDRLPFYIEATLNRCLQTPCNNSPVLNNDPIPVFCTNEGFIYNMGAVDPDGDSLSYRFAQILTDSVTPVIYKDSYTFDKPMPWTGQYNQVFPNGINCNPVNGDIMFTPSSPLGTNFRGAFGVQIKQWRKINGVTKVIGITQRDVEMTITGNCLPNNPPILQTDTQHAKLQTSWQVAAFSQFCFTVTAKDTIDLEDITYLSWDKSLAQYGATFSPTYKQADRTLNGPREDSYQFCWSPNPIYVRSQPYYFTITAKDKQCPNIGRVIKSFSIKVTKYVGIDELSQAWGLKVFPNPTKNILNINLETLLANASEKNIQLFDVLGKLLIQQELKYSQQLNIETLAPGLYILKIGEWNGQVIKE
jgi:hypothetical protein